MNTNEPTSAGEDLLNIFFAALDAENAPGMRDEARVISRDVKRVITHKNCQDGAFAAALCRLHWPDAEYIYCQYGEQQLALTPGPATLFVDFSPHPDNADAWREHKPFIMDHHKSAEWLVASFPHSIYSPADSGAQILLNELRSSCIPFSVTLLIPQQKALAYIIELVSIRDTWQKGNENWGEACELWEAAALFDYESKDFLDDVTKFIVNFPEYGRNKIAARQAEFAESLIQAEPMTLTCEGSDAIGLVTYAAVDISNFAEYARSHGVELVVGVRPRQTGGRLRWAVSFRGAGKFDCAEIAKFCGGGGHHDAAGAILSWSNPPTAESLSRLIAEACPEHREIVAESTGVSSTSYAIPLGD
jgi:hypothetical protein